MGLKNVQVEYVDLERFFAVNWLFGIIRSSFGILEHCWRLEA